MQTKNICISSTNFTKKYVLSKRAFENMDATYTKYSFLGKGAQMLKCA